MLQSFKPCDPTAIYLRQGQPVKLNSNTLLYQQSLKWTPALSHTLPGRRRGQLALGLSASMSQDAGSWRSGNPRFAGSRARAIQICLKVAA